MKNYYSLIVIACILFFGAAFVYADYVDEKHDAEQLYKYKYVTGDSVRFVNAYAKADAGVIRKYDRICMDKRSEASKRNRQIKNAIASWEK